MRGLLAAAVRVKTAADVALGCGGTTAVAIRVCAAADVTLAGGRDMATAIRVCSAADVPLSRGRAVATATWIEATADVAPESCQLAPELTQEGRRGGLMILPWRGGAPWRGEQNAEDEQHGGTVNEGSTHDGLLSGGKYFHRLWCLVLPWKSPDNSLQRRHFRREVMP